MSESTYWIAILRSGERVRFEIRERGGDYVAIAEGWVCGGPKLDVALRRAADMASQYEKVVVELLCDGEETRAELLAKIKALETRGG